MNRSGLQELLLLCDLKQSQNKVNFFSASLRFVSFGSFFTLAPYSLGAQIERKALSQALLV